MSTPPVTGSCSEYKPKCIGHTQKALFYTALALIAVGISGHAVSLHSFLQEQTKSEDNEEESDSKILWQIPGGLAVVFVPIIGAIALPFINPWSIRFGIPAICTVVATILFLTGLRSYKFKSPEGSPLTILLRVFAAAASKMFQPLPSDAKELYEKNDPHSVPHTRSLRCLDKAAIMLPTQDQEEQKKNKWGLCSVNEVEEIKIVLRMIPMWITFVICGVIISIGNTYFVEQANHMDRKLGRIKVPLPIFLFFYNCSKAVSTSLYTALASGLKQYAPPIGVALAMVSSILCCITAAKVETRRLNTIRGHGLLDKPNDKIPMNIFWLLPQFVLLAILDGLCLNSIKGFFKNQVPSSMKNYLLYFTTGVLGLGTMASVLSVYLVGKVSERKGNPNWFQYTLSKSHLDRYYWTLAALSAVNLVIYIVVACFYSYRVPESEEEEPAENGDFPEPYDEDNAKCCC